MGHGKKWKEIEDKALASAYAELTCAGIKSGVTFWKAVRDRIKGVRSARSQQNRWTLIAQDIKIFIDCLETGAGGEEVGNEALEKAKCKFRVQEGRDFEFVDCWRLVRNCPKFSPVKAVPMCETPALSGPLSAATETKSRVFAATRSFPESNRAPKATTELPHILTTTSSAAATGHDKNTEMRNASKTIALPKLESTFVHHQLTSEMRRKNDLQEDELAMKLFGEPRESKEAQSFFNLLKRKKLLQLEQDVYELEQAQQRRRQRRS